MSSTPLVRWSGLAVLLGGLAHALFVLIHPFSGLSDPHVIHSGRWLVAHNLHLLGAVFVLLGLPGLYVSGLRRAGRLGLVGYLVAFVGTALHAGSGMFTAYVVPLAPALADPSGPAQGSPFVAVFLLLTLAMIAGFTLLALAGLRAGALPGWVGLPLILGAVLFNVPAVAVPYAIPLVGGVLVGAGLGGWGYALWSGPAGPVAQPRPAAL
jgi:hypothetical protein